MTTTEDRASAAPRTGRGRSLAKELLFVVVGALVVSSLLRALVGQMFIIPSDSMQNTLLVGDRVVVQKITDFHRGDVVVFEDPGGWLNESSADPGPFDRVLEFVGIPTQSTPGHLIKRVIGTAGDRVICCDKQDRITVNGQALDERGYLYTDPDGTQVVPSETRFEVVVPRDRIFVLGDHRDVSADSRCHLADLSSDGRQGQIAFPPLSTVVGPAFAIAAPFDRATRLRTPATFASVPPSADPAPEEAVIKPKGVTC
ncbi:MAG: Signal peptidase [Friedmanniella sp.]|nr:Signal peptidase [Friedmanniella sp.]